MKNDTGLGIAIILGIIVIAAFSGFKNSQNIGTGKTNQNQIISENPSTDKMVSVQTAKTEIPEVSLSYVSHSTDPSQEYIVIQSRGTNTKTIPITGWTLKSLSSGTTVNIPKGTELYFQKIVNAEGDVNISSGDTVYLITGSSPINVSFKLNKCSGYLEQFQHFNPLIYTSCPSPRNEDLSSIKNISANDACLDYIDSFPMCRTQTENLPVTWTYECKNFIETKLSYSACLNTHKNDKDFYGHEWRLYLKHGQSLWKSRREDIVLIDNKGNVVSELKY